MDFFHFLGGFFILMKPGQWRSLSIMRIGIEHVKAVAFLEARKRAMRICHHKWYFFAFFKN